MFATGIIVFREVLEAALIIGILAAATRGIAGSRRWLLAGVVSGLVGSALLALSTDVIAGWADGVGQELFNALVLGVAVVMLAWHNIWMSSHGAELAANAKSLGGAIRAGSSECSALLLIVGIAVLREGAETVLFLYGIATAEENSRSAMLLGGGLGVLGGVVVGYILYAGLLRLPLRWFFAATGVLVLLLAASMASQAARFLIQADLLPALGAPLWDSSSLISEQSVLGMLLHSLLGYDSHPAGMQVIFYVSVLLLIGVAMRWVARGHAAARGAA